MCLLMTHYAFSIIPLHVCYGLVVQCLYCAMLRRFMTLTLLLGSICLAVEGLKECCRWLCVVWKRFEALGLSWIWSRWQFVLRFAAQMAVWYAVEHVCLHLYYHPDAPVQPCGVFHILSNPSSTSISHWVWFSTTRQR
jgi:hypothetical protein